LLGNFCCCLLLLSTNKRQKPKKLGFFAKQIQNAKAKEAKI
jgi:hypothetical protein